MAEDTQPSPGGAMGFLDHLEELRRRLFYSALAILAGMGLCLPYSRRIFLFLCEPINRYLPPGTSLAYTRLAEPFMNYFKVAALAGLVVASPVVLYQFWLFVSPGLYRHERRYALTFVLLATGCFLLGVWFGYALVFPSMCKFFLTVGQGLTMVVTMDEYFTMLTWTVLGLGGVFELPVLILILARFGIVSARFLWKHSGTAIFICFLVAAIITPTPDMVTMTMVALPLVGLYFLSIGVAYFVAPKPETASPAP